MTATDLWRDAVVIRRAGADGMTILDHLGHVLQYVVGRFVLPGTLTLGGRSYRVDFPLELVAREGRHYVKGRLATTFEAFAQHPGVQEMLPSIVDDMDLIASLAIRNRASLAGNLINAAYASSMDDLLREANIALWIHGHTHYCVDYEKYGVRILSNQRGYPGEDTEGFDANMLLDL